MNAAKHPAGIQCDRKVRATKDGKREGETATEARNRRHEAHGVTPTEARHLNHEARGVTPTEARIQNYKAAGRTRADDEIAYTLKHGFPRASRGDGFGNLAHAFIMLQQQHIHNAMWLYELTGSTGTVEDLHIQLRSPIVHTLYDWMQPSALSSGSHSLQVLLRHMGQRGLFMVVDCEFVSPQHLSADHDIDIDLSDLPSVYARIYDLAIIICDADGNVVERVFHESSCPLTARIKLSLLPRWPQAAPSWIAQYTFSARTVVRPSGSGGVIQRTRWAASPS